MTRTNKRGFTLVEILIVVIILGILAAIVIPQFTNASKEAKQSSLVTMVQSLRSQIALFKLQHNDYLPGQLALVGGAQGGQGRVQVPGQQRLGHLRQVRRLAHRSAALGSPRAGTTSTSPADPHQRQRTSSTWTARSRSSSRESSPATV